jgi:predicted small lipoprotein YifL
MLIALISCGRKGDLIVPEEPKNPNFGGVSDEMKSNPEFEKKVQAKNKNYKRMDYPQSTIYQPR